MILGLIVTTAVISGMILFFIHRIYFKIDRMHYQSESLPRILLFDGIPDLF
jgi:hypothetical protein